MIYEVRSNGDHWEGAFRKRADADAYVRALLEGNGVRAKVYEVDKCTQCTKPLTHCVQRWENEVGALQGEIYCSEECAEKRVNTWMREP